MEKYYKMTSMCLLFLSAITLAAVLSLAKVILIPFTMALFISLIYSPCIAYLNQKFKLPRPFALIVSLISFVAICIITIFFISTSIDNFIQDADKYSIQIQQASQLVSKLSQDLGLNTANFSIQEQIQKLTSANMLKVIVRELAEIFSNAFLVIVFVLFFMAGETVSKRDIPILEEIKKSVAIYVGTKLITSLLTGLLTYIVLKIFHVEMAFMFAIVTFLFNFIPNIGSLIALIIPIPIIFLQYSFGFQFFLCIGLMLIIQTLVGNVLEPKIQGESMGLHPVTVLFCLTFWGFIWGVPGMFLSVPITASVRIILSKFSATKSLSEIFAGNLNAFKN